MKQDKLISEIASVVRKFDIVNHGVSKRLQIRVTLGNKSKAETKLAEIFSDTAQWEVTEDFTLGDPVGKYYVEQD